MPPSSIGSHFGAYSPSANSPSDFRQERASPNTERLNTGKTLLSTLSKSSKSHTDLDARLFGGKKATLSTQFLWLETNRMSEQQAGLLGLALAQFLPENTVPNIAAQRFDGNEGRLELLDKSHADHVVYRCDDHMRLCFLSVRGTVREHNAQIPVLVEIEAEGTSSSSASSVASVASSRRPSPHPLQLQLSRPASKSGSPSERSQEHEPSSSPLPDFLARTPPTAMVEVAVPAPAPHAADAALSPDEPDPLDMAWEMFGEDAPPQRSDKRPATSTPEAAPSPKHPRVDAAKGKEKAVDTSSDSDDDSLGSHSDDSEFERALNEQLMRELAHVESRPAAGSSRGAGTSADPFDLMTPAPPDRGGLPTDQEFLETSAACIRVVERNRVGSWSVGTLPLNVMTVRDVERLLRSSSPPRELTDWLAVRQRIVDASGRRTQLLFINKEGKQEEKALLDARARRKPQGNAVPSASSLASFKNIIPEQPHVAEERHIVFSEEERSQLKGVEDKELHFLCNDPDGPRFEKHEIRAITNRYHGITALHALARNWDYLESVAQIDKELAFEIAQRSHGGYALNAMADHWDKLTIDLDGPHLVRDQIIEAARRFQGGVALHAMAKYWRNLSDMNNGPGLDAARALAIARMESGGTALRHLAKNWEKLTNTESGLGLDRDTVLQIAQKYNGGRELSTRLAELRTQ